MILQHFKEKMKLRTRFKLTVEDESTLENRLTVSASVLKWVLVGVAGMLLAMACGAFLLLVSPAKRLLPGYLKESERAASEMQHLRLDSLHNAFLNNERYIDNVMEILEGRPISPDTAARIPSSGSDSLLPPSVEERRFVSLIRDREKYNVSVIAPLTAESMMFNPINDESIISNASKGKRKAEIILAKGSTVAAIADGRVISVSQSVREGGGSAVIIQHPKGFLSRCSRLGSVLVEVGDEVSGGQIIAVQNTTNALKEEIVSVELWHNGTPLSPSDYIGDVTPGYTPD
ncbi:MAG: M23 family metallopeptidase [Muribaculaceae bacterium]|nr:M23 family metallopeptidase [Bacteroides sp.]MDE6226272.1 M23 family metallopeptidase [Muribaculaceae bacterium]